jgi:hypothetical protein
VTLAGNGDGRAYPGVFYEMRAYSTALSDTAMGTVLAQMETKWLTPAP